MISFFSTKLCLLGTHLLLQDSNIFIGNVERTMYETLICWQHNPSQSSSNADSVVVNEVRLNIEGNQVKV